MKLSKRSTSSLTPDPRNARRHSEKNLAAIEASLRLFGQRRAAVVRSDGTILAGNGMVEAAKRLGLEEVFVHVVPDEWTEDEARAFALADNRTAELAEWDEDVLATHLVELDIAGIDLSDLGFVSASFDPVEDDEQPRLDERKEQGPCPSCGVRWKPLAGGEFEIL